ncbi:ABC transporter substrate-binding protein [Bradyrhizobium sp. URHA0013]|uniref:ABC transporter substrate-binding protein n=1 Tax=Bradyrhizobium sp. URHA0013 TaxID=1380352 RepID=UPI001FD973C9|nr:ABC transporter substrate-binding protein [Bradyrhizobium sp. URHA0013]
MPRWSFLQNCFSELGGKKMRLGLWLRNAIFVACFALATVTPSFAQKSADTLRITWRDAIPDVDPYYNSQRTGMVVAFQAFDCLVYRDPISMEIKPALAISWQQVDLTTIDFSLRQGVTFQNGDPFSADDVVYTFNTIIRDKRVAIPAYYSSFAAAEKLDHFRVRIKLTGVSPAVMEYLAMVTPIWPKAYREKLGPDGFSRAPIGTGPYKITRVDGTTQIEMERYEGHYAGSPKGRPAIRYIKIHQVPDATTEMTELLGGKADWIWGYNADQFANLAKVPNLEAMRFGTMRVHFMTIDAAGRTGADNPLTKLKVRQAILTAIDRQTMAKQLIQGDSQVIDTPCYPSQFGCDVSAAVKYPYDPEKAKQLLAEAGYPNGFETEIISYNTPQINAALQNYLKAVGINLRIQQLQIGAVIRKAEAGEAPLYCGSWGSNSINDVSAFIPYFLGGGLDDYARDPDVQELVKAAGNTLDPDVRRQAYSQAIRLATERAEFVPLFSAVRYVAFSKQLTFQGFPDDLPRFYLSSWK